MQNNSISWIKENMVKKMETKKNFMKFCEWCDGCDW